MGDDSIQQLTMPKWGLAMTHGKVVDWLVAEGAEITAGTEFLEVETEKITGNVESPVSGTLRRRVAEPGLDVPIGGLLGVVADASVADADIDRFVECFKTEDIEDGEVAADDTPLFVEVGGRRLCYLKRGDDGPAVVLIHGFAGDLNNWLFNHGTLAENHTVYALDLPGHGQSSKDVGDASLEFFVDAVRDWLDAMELETAHFVGHSMGGLICLTLAERYPERVLSCTLIATAGLGPEINHEYITGVVEADRRKQLKPHLEKLFANPAQVTRQLVDDVLKFKRLDGVRDALRSLANKFIVDGQQAWVIGKTRQQLSVPLLVIWGAVDQIVPSKHASGFPQTAQVEILDGCGHMVQMEAAGDVNRLVQQFLAGVPS
jgi:pyruvate dehydrogenase E2 component (dihydrolipoamide acetyltransferase)